MKSDRSRRASARSKKHCFHRCGSLFLLLLHARTGPISRWRVLITMFAHGINSRSYLYDLFQTNVGGRRTATETNQKVIQIDFRQKIINYFYSERKAIKTQMSLTYKEISNTDNAVWNLVRSVTSRFILRNSVTEAHKNIMVNYGH